MKQDERDELLITVREDIKHIKEWTLEHKEHHKIEKAQTRRYITLVWATLCGVLAKAIFWN